MIIAATATKVCEGCVNRKNSMTVCNVFNEMYGKDCATERIIYVDSKEEYKDMTEDDTRKIKRSDLL